MKKKSVQYEGERMEMRTEIDQGDNYATLSRVLQKMTAWVIVRVS